MFEAEFPDGSVKSVVFLLNFFSLLFICAREGSEVSVISLMLVLTIHHIIWHIIGSPEGRKQGLKFIILNL